jgi:hypothetical protein
MRILSFGFSRACYPLDNGKRQSSENLNRSGLRFLDPLQRWSPSDGGHVRFIRFDSRLRHHHGAVLIVFIAAMRHPSTSRTIAVYVIMFLTGLWWRCTTWPIGLPSRISTTGNRLGQRFYRMRLYQENGGEVRFRSLLIKALTIFFLVIFSLGLYYLVEAIALFVSPSHRGFADVVSERL